jgi:ubiquinone/menaquinone biosynthesis C-methylase UbiE
MSSPSEPRRVFASTYIVSDRANQEEIARLLVQARLLTSTMGGLLAEQSEPTRFERLLDVGCGPGCWSIEMAQTYPNLSLLVGIDISEKMLNAARKEAIARKVNDRVEFHLMDALGHLEFPAEYFSLVNQRSGISWMRKWDWPRLLQEYQRVLCAGGVVRITEVNGALESPSPALARLWDMGAQAFYQAGLSFTLSGDGLDEEIVRLLVRYGLEEVQIRAYTLEYRAGTVEGQLFVEDMLSLFHTMKPFLQKWVRLPGNYEAIYQQMAREIQEPNFVATARLSTIWGTKPR